MPGFITHYLFGISTYHAMKPNVFHNLIRKYPHAFALGLQGPDIFFYYLPGYRRKPAPGSMAHSQKTGAFLQALIQSCEKQPSSIRDAAYCYVAGFLGHYTLDTTCHPYIYDKTKYQENEPAYFGRHVYLETDIDKKMLSYYKKMIPSDFYQDRTIRLSSVERKAVAHCLNYAYSTVFPKLRLTYADMYLATFLMPLGVAVLHDTHGIKKLLVRKLENYFPGYPFVSPLIPSDRYEFTTDPLNLRHRKWKNPWDTSLTSTDSFHDLLKKARQSYLHRLTLLKQRQFSELTEHLGNCSYNSGLPLV